MGQQASTAFAEPVRTGAGVDRFKADDSSAVLQVRIRLQAGLGCIRCEMNFYRAQHWATQSAGRARHCALILVTDGAAQPAEIAVVQAALRLFWAVFMDTHFP